MARHDDTVYLRYILDAIARIQQYIHSIDEDSFLQNPLIQDGVIRQEQIIGEASRRLSLDLRNRYLAIPWQDVVGMRSKLVHDYFGVDLEAVWLAATRDIPQMKEEVGRILADIASS